MGVKKGKKSDYSQMIPDGKGNVKYREFSEIRAAIVRLRKIVIPAQAGIQTW
jgi:hypothetical protein